MTEVMRGTPSLDGVCQIDNKRTVTGAEIGIDVDSAVSSTGKLASWKWHGIEKAYIDNDGIMYFNEIPQSVNLASLDADLTNKQYVDTLVAYGITWKEPVLDATLSDPPISPNLGDRYVVAPTGSGAWNTHDNEIATWAGSNWTFEIPSQGWAVLSLANNVGYDYNGSVWIKFSSAVVYTGSNGVKKVGYDFQADIKTNDGITLDTGQLKVDYDDSSIGIVSNQLAVKTSGITNDMLNGFIENDKLNTISSALKVDWLAVNKFSSVLNDIGNVSAPTPSNNDVITYNSATLKWESQAGGGGGTGDFVPEEITVLIQTNVVWTNMPLALTELFGSTAYRKMVDLTGAAKYRLVFTQAVAGAVGADLNVQYSINNGTNWFALDLVSGAGEVNANTTGNKVGTWVDIAVGAKQPVLLRIVGKDGDGVLDPSFRAMCIQLQYNSTYVVGGSSGSIYSEWSICATPATALTWTNMPAAVTEFLGTTYNRNKFKLNNAVQYRIIANQAVVGFAGADINLQYSTNGVNWSACDTGGSGELDIGTGTGLKVGAWTPLVAGAKDDVFLRLVGKQGDGIVDPSWREIKVQFNFAGGGTGSPGGLDTNIQFNNGGLFGGDSNFVWDNVNKFLGIGTVPTSRLHTLDTILASGTTSRVSNYFKTVVQPIGVHDASVDTFITSLEFSNPSGYALEGDYVANFNQVITTGTGVIDAVYAMFGRVFNQVNMGSPNVTGTKNIWGMFFDVYQATDNSRVDDATAFFGRVEVTGNGAVQRAKAARFTIESTKASTIGEAVGIDIAILNLSTGIMTNVYGINVNSALPAFNNNNQKRIGINIPNMPSVGGYSGCESYSIKTGTGTAYIGGNLETVGTMKIGAYTLPNTDGSLNQILKTNGSGVVTWSSNSNAGGSNTEIQFNDVGAFGGIPRITYTKGTTTLKMLSNNYKWYMTSAPLVYGGNDYDFALDAHFGLPGYANCLADKATMTITEIPKVSPTRITNADGTTNFGVALFNIDLGGGSYVYVTLYFKDTDFADKAAFDAWIFIVSGGAISTSDYFAKSVWTAGGITDDYAWVGTLPIVATYASPPTMIASMIPAFEYDGLEVKIGSSSSLNSLQYNSNGVITGSPSLYWDDSQKLLNVYGGNETNPGIQLLNSNVSQPFSGYLDISSIGRIGAFNPATGDYHLSIFGITQDNTTPALSLIGIVGATTVNYPAVLVQTHKNDGAGNIIALGNHEIAFGVGNGSTNPLWVYGDGSIITPYMSSYIDGDYATVQIYGISATNAPTCVLQRARGTPSALTQIQNGDNLGSLSFAGYLSDDGSGSPGYMYSAYIQAISDGTLGTGALPTSLYFKTAGTIGSPQDRMKLCANGKLLVATTSDITYGGLNAIAEFNTTAYSGVGIKSANEAHNPGLFFFAGADNANKYIGSISGAGANHTIAEVANRVWIHSLKEGLAFSTSGSGHTADFYIGNIGTPGAIPQLSVTDDSVTINTGQIGNVRICNNYVPAYLTGGNAATSNPVTWLAVTDGSFNMTIDGTARSMSGIDFTDVAAYTPAYLTGGTNAEDDYTVWEAIDDGEFAITINGTPRNVTGIDFTGVTTMAEVATTIENAIRAVTSAVETCVWSTDHFVISSIDTTSISAITVTSTVSGGTGTDISIVSLSDTNVTNGSVTDAVSTMDMDDVAAAIQLAIRSQTGSLETCVWSTDHFIISSVDSWVTSAITVTSAAGLGTDISGVGATAFLDAETGRGTVTNKVGIDTYNLLVTDYILSVGYTGVGATSIVLPTAQLVSGRTIIIKDAAGNATSNTITVSTQGAEDIDGADTKVIASNYGSLALYSDGYNWYISHSTGTIT